MKIELYIDGEKKTFTTPFVPMLAKRKYLEYEAKLEKKAEDGVAATAVSKIDEIDEMCMILSDIVFDNKFTPEQLIAGASEDYLYEKTAEAVFGIKQPKKKEIEEGNEQGK